MRTRVPISVLILILTLLILSTSACARRMIQGRVVDAVTGKTIEKAAVYIEWSKIGSGPPGLAGSVRVERAEDISDAEGIFHVPKYSTLLKDFQMAVYKKGYVCWSNEDIFPTYEKRKGFRLEDGVVIKLERFKNEYSKEKHAYFTTISSTGRKGNGLFEQAIKSEIELRSKIIRSRKNRRK